MHFHTRTAIYFWLYCELFFTSGTENYFFIGAENYFHGIVNLFFGLQYIAGLRLRGTGRVFDFPARRPFWKLYECFLKRMPRRNLNVKGFVSLREIDEVFWTGCKTRTFSFRHLCGFIFLETNKSVQRQITCTWDSHECHNRNDVVKSVEFLS